MSFIDERGRISLRMAGTVDRGRGRGRTPVVVRNLSIAGAMIELANAPAEGDKVIFECSATGKVDARIAWVVGNRCGLQFNAIVRLDSAASEAAA
jgi:hypothetical protein